MGWPVDWLKDWLTDQSQSTWRTEGKKVASWKPSKNSAKCWKVRWKKGEYKSGTFTCLKAGHDSTKSFIYSGVLRVLVFTRALFIICLVCEDLAIFNSTKTPAKVAAIKRAKPKAKTSNAHVYGPITIEFHRIHLPEYCLLLCQTNHLYFHLQEKYYFVQFLLLHQGCLDFHPAITVKNQWNDQCIHNIDWIVSHIGFQIGKSILDLRWKQSKWMINLQEE